MDGVPYPQPLAGPEPQYVPWGVLLVRAIGHTPRPVQTPAADQRSRAYPTLLRVLRWGRYGHRGGPQTPKVGSLTCASRGPFSSRPAFRCMVCSGGFPVAPGWGGGGGGALFASSGRVACVRVPTSPGCRSPPVAADGPPPSLAVGPGLRCGSPPLLAGVLWCWWGVGLRHTWLWSAGLLGVVPRFRLWVRRWRSLASSG